MRVEGLKLFYVVTPFEGLGEAVLDREGPWTNELLEYHGGHAAEIGAPPRAGLFVWEGHAESEPDELVGGWDFEGTWRGPTPEELARLAVGKFPLRGHAFPATGAEEDFEEAPRRRMDPIKVESFKLFIFDADATLRRCTVPGQPCPNRSNEWEVIDGVRERLAQIDWSRKGFGIVSNQAGVALGYLREEDAYQMLADLTVALTERWPPAGSLQICPHAPDAGCDCRKPKPSMLRAVMNTYDIGPDCTLFVGDLDSDRLAAEAAACSFAWSWDFFGTTREEWAVLVAGGAR